MKLTIKQVMQIDEIMLETLKEKIEGKSKDEWPSEKEYFEMLRERINKEVK